MDELNIGGKLYISTRRAAKDYKYHSDYLGQLIRAGKLDGHKVGRSWYILNDSMQAFLAKDAQMLAEKLSQQAYVPAMPIAPRPVAVPVMPHITRMPVAPAPVLPVHDSTMLTYARSKKEGVVEEVPLYRNESAEEAYHAIEEHPQRVAEPTPTIVRTLPTPPPVPTSKVSQVPKRSIGKSVASTLSLAAIGIAVFIVAISYALNINLVWPR